MIGNAPVMSYQLQRKKHFMYMRSIYTNIFFPSLRNIQFSITRNIRNIIRN